MMASMNENERFGFNGSDLFGFTIFYFESVTFQVSSIFGHLEGALYNDLSHPSCNGGINIYKNDIPSNLNSIMVS